MCNHTEKNREKGEKLIHALLKGAGLSGFSFDTFFTLRFCRNEAVEFEGHILPWIFELQILSDWWFDSKDKWQSRVNQFDTRQLIEPDEPVKAFELASIRWMEGSDVDVVEIGEEVMMIKFRSGKTMTISLNSEEDYSWIVKGLEVPESKLMWSISCEDGELYVQTP